MAKIEVVEVVLKAANGKNKVTAVISLQCEDQTCKAKVIAIRAKHPSTSFDLTIGKIGFAVTNEMTITNGVLDGKCIKGKCVYTISAFWTIRTTLTILFRINDKRATTTVSGTFTSKCICQNQKE